MTDFKKYIPRFAGFMAGMILLLEIFSVIFDGGFWFRQHYIFDRNARIAQITTEPPGEIDVFNVGDSLSTSALAPLELFRDYGITSFNCGQDLQKPIESYFALKTALRDQPVKVLLYESHNLFENEDTLDYYQSRLAEFLRYEFPVLRYHYVWLKWFKRKGIRKYFKGFLVNDGLDPYSGEEYYDWDSKKMAGIPEVNREAFEKVLALCQKRSVRLVLYSAVSPVCYDITMHNRLAAVAKKYGIDYIDANYDRDKIQMDWNKDTHDQGDHLNIHGSRKMTTYLGDYLKENCDLPDHRGDPAYQSWSDLWTPYEENIEEMKGTFYSILEDQLGGFH